MINLIPGTAKKRVLLEYRFRVGALGLFLVTLSAVTYSLFLLPSLLVIQSQYATVVPQIESMTAETVNYEAAVDAVEEVNKLSAFLDTIYSTQPMLDVIENIELLAGEDIAITQTNLERTEELTISLATISGVATTRSALADFKDRLENDPIFSNVNLPLSNLAKDVDVPFEISLNINIEES